MIPRHRPPFGVADILGLMLKYRSGFDVERTEAEFAKVADGAHAVLLPSARAGIYWALNAALEPGTRVVCPAYTCNVVHEAVARAGMNLDLIDTTEEGFLMDDDALRAAQDGPHAVVLCEIYGYAYDLSTMAGGSQAEPPIRIIDMAMSVPQEKLFKRLQGNDFAVISFGIGKCMYAGWGGMGFTRDSKLAAELRNRRDSLLTESNSLLSMKRSLGILSRTMAHDGSLYGLMRKMKQARFPRKKKRKLPSSGLPRNWIGQENPSSEWVSPSTYLDRRLALCNLERANHYYSRRVNLARRYHENFEAVAGMARPEISEDPLSHYTIRVKGILRKVIREYLWKSGIDVGTLFRFPAYLSGDDYPNASRMASEILNLPLDANLTISDADRISECVKRALKASERHALSGQIGARYSAA